MRVQERRPHLPSGGVNLRRLSAPALPPAAGDVGSSADRMDGAYSPDPTSGRPHPLDDDR